MDYNILSWLIWLPIIGVAVIAFVPRDKEEIIKIVSALALVYNSYLLWFFGKF